MPHFRAELTFPFPIDAVYRFHARAENLAEIAPPGAQVTIVEQPVAIAPGGEIELQVGFLGMTQKIRLRITDADEPRLIADEQIVGPFKKWRQRHLFERTSDGGTRLTYEVEFEPPGGMVGMFLTADRVLDGLKSSVAVREKRTAEKLAAEASSSK